MVRYRQTLVGAGWTLLQPITMMIIFTIFFGALVRFPTDNVPYPVFVYTGLLVYQAATKIMNEGGTSVQSGAALLNKIYFPRAYFPTSVALASLVDLLFSSIALGLLLIWFGIVPRLSIVFAPAMIFIAIVASLGLAFWLSALNAKYRDIAQLLPFFTQLLMFVSPIIYSSSLIPAQYLPLYWLNPMAVVINGLRAVVARTEWPPTEAWIIGGTMAVVLFVSGYLFFRKQEPSFSDFA